MGAEQSSPQNGEGAQVHESGPVKRDYYEVLEVGRQATNDEIKKAYRSKALELHPDRNFGDVENATAKFAEVQSAYEVLSDPQERAWYDSHRESILGGNSPSAGEEEHYEHNVRLTSTGDIVSLMSRFNSSVPFTDAPNGFYGILSEVFANLAREEDAACDWEGIEPLDYPEFGSKEDNYEDFVRPFYRVWINFSTRKTFSWRDRYKASDAPDRATRRLVEKENKKFRDEGIRDFNDAVRALVTFVRKRDPRYTSNLQTEADRQKHLRDAAAAQAARSRAANQAKLSDHVVADWAKTKQPEDHYFLESEEEEDAEHIECVVCGKTFKSEKQYETHEKSKKHQKAVQKIQREMKKENRRLNLDDRSENSGYTVLEQKVEKLDLQLQDVEGTEKCSVSGQINLSEETGHNKSGDADPDPESNEEAHSFPDESDLGDEYGTREEIENRLFGTIHAVNDRNASPSPAGDNTSILHPKLGKAKVKRAKKAARQELDNTLDIKCAACDQSFSSRTKLFTHVKELNHAQPVPRTGQKWNKKRLF